ncbi:MAG: ADP-ribosylglycohydrolase family protein [Erysipelotrichaceae bacterium]
MNNLDKYRGCLIGGAVGDALGYAVEFNSKYDIFAYYGANGIEEYKLNRSGLAEISDDTQMTLFTANGLLSAFNSNDISDYLNSIALAYRDWYQTQNKNYPLPKGSSHCWLTNLANLFYCRAPGNTCLSALEGTTLGSIAKPINNSKGCGGIMRVAPIGLYFNADKLTIEQLDTFGAEAAALTHGHPLGYIAAAALVHIVNLLAHKAEITILQATMDMKRTIAHLFENEQCLTEFFNLIDKAIELAQNEKVDDLTAIERLGAGWVAEETLAIALYCALKYHNNFAKAVTAAVNHGGDSDSTGAVTGNILGASLGLSAIPERYLTNLELKETIIEIADDLYRGSNTSKEQLVADKLWQQKYVSCLYPFD